MKHRIEELAQRREELLRRSERLRDEFAADQEVVMDSIAGVDRAISTARRLASPVLLTLAGLAALGFMRRGRPAAAMATAARPAGLAVRAMMLISLIRRFMPYVGLARAVLRARAARRADSGYL